MSDKYKRMVSSIIEGKEPLSNDDIQQMEEDKFVDKVLAKLRKGKMDERSVNALATMAGTAYTRGSASIGKKEIIKELKWALDTFLRFYRSHPKKAQEIFWKCEGWVPTSQAIRAFYKGIN